ncbi:disrupted in schizophrenia 1 protein isoform X2 [Paroedura picta]|uniref:disrupted in schizophrenia 1 protein isoform X2 n=1 Tax=Paroedura picta TaxID=143630 RepID=UPI00405726F2
MWSSSSADRRQPQRSPPGPGKAGPSPDFQGCLLPSGSFCKKKLAKRPGYLRTGELQQIEFHPPVDYEPFIPKKLEHHGRKLHRDFKNCCLKRPSKTELGLCHRNVCACTKVPSDVATGSATVEPAADYRVQQSENLILPVSPLVAGCKEDALPVYSSHSSQTNLLDSVKDTAFNHSSQEKKRMHAFCQKALNNHQELESKEIVCGSVSQGHFNSSFSFIQQSLNPAFETSGIVDPSDCGPISDPQDVLQIQVLIIKLQKLQEKAVAEDDYERADKFRGKLEELENAKRSLKFQLPSQHPSISSFLDRFRIQVQMALSGDINRFNREEAVFVQKNEQKVFRLTCQEKIQISFNKRDQLLKEKQWIQKEIELLKARLAFLEAKDQQLRQEIENQDPLIQMLDSELSTLLSWVSHEELQTIGKSLADTLKASHQIPCSLDFPESIKRLQEKEWSLNISIKDTAAEVCTSQKLCSTLRGKVSDIETQLPALLEAKMLAISGGNFCAAKDLVEEIKSLTAERERLEGLLHEWLALSARNVQKLERMKEGYKKLKEEMEQRETAFERTLKENIFKYMAILEEQLQSCVSQFLERVWEVDLEACQLLIQEFQWKEGGCGVCDGEESQTDEVEDAVEVLLSTKRQQSKHFPVKDSKYPVTQNKAHWDSKEELPVLSTELEEKCEQISKKLLHLEDQLHTAICSCDENLSHILCDSLCLIFQVKF